MSSLLWLGNFLVASSQSRGLCARVCVCVCVCAATERLKLSLAVIITSLHVSAALNPLSLFHCPFPRYPSQGIIHRPVAALADIFFMLERRAGTNLFMISPPVEAQRSYCPPPSTALSLLPPPNRIYVYEVRNIGFEKGSN